MTTWDGRQRENREKRARLERESKYRKMLSSIPAKGIQKHALELLVEKGTDALIDIIIKHEDQELLQDMLEAYEKGEWK